MKGLPPYRQREVGGKAAQAPEIELIALSTIAVAQFACIAGHAFYSHIEVASRGAGGRPELQRGVARGCVIPTKSWA